MANNAIGLVVESITEVAGTVVKLLPNILDGFSNFSYWLWTGRNYKEIELLEAAAETENIERYEYIPLSNLFDLKKVEGSVMYEYIEGEKDGVRATIGRTVEGELKEFDILEGHTMVGGASRWGKSSFLNVWITSIMKTYTPNEVMFLGCDFKRSDIYYFRKYKHFRGMSVNKEHFMEQMKGLEKEIKARSKILDDSNCRNVIKYNKVSEKKLGYIVFVIDELIQLTQDKECNELLHSMMSKCASYGIYFILASQDFTKQTIGKCKMNCSQIVGFHTLDQTDSETLIGKDHNLQDITVKGRCKIKNSEGVVETQVFYIEEEEIEEYLQKYKKE